MLIINHIIVNHSWILKTVSSDIFIQQKKWIQICTRNITEYPFSNIKAKMKMWVENHVLETYSSIEMVVISIPRCNSLHVFNDLIYNVPNFHCWKCCNMALIVNFGNVLRRIEIMKLLWEIRLLTSWTHLMF